MRNARAGSLASAILWGCGGVIFRDPRLTDRLEMLAQNCTNALLDSCTAEGLLVIASVKA